MSGSKLYGFFLILLWGLALNIAFSISKLIDPEIPTVIKVFVRLGFGFLGCIPFLIKSKFSFLQSKKLKLHLFRTILSLTAMLCTYYAYSKLPLTTATAIGFCGPFFTIFLSVIFLNEKLHFYKIFWLIVGYLGVLLVIKPMGFVSNIGILASLGASLFASAALILAKKLNNTESTLTMLMYTNLLSFLLAGLVAIPTWVTPSWKDFMLLFFMGLSGLSSQFLYLEALKTASPSFLAPFEYFRLILAVPFSFVIFGDVPDKWIFIGSSIIMVSNLVLNFISNKKDTSQTIQ